MGLIERAIRHLKEKVRATTSEFPFMWILILVLIQTVYICAFWINAFLNRSENFGFSPREIVTGLSTDYKRDCKVDIGSYVEASADATVTNDNTERTRSCIALGPVGNRQGSVKSRLNVLTSSREKLHRRTVTQLPWPLDNRLVKKLKNGTKKGLVQLKRAALIFLTEKKRDLIGKMMIFLS